MRRGRWVFYLSVNLEPDHGCLWPASYSTKNQVREYWSDIKSWKKSLMVIVFFDSFYYHAYFAIFDGFRNIIFLQVCTKCHHQCAECDSRGNYRCLKCKHYRNEDSTCVDKCPTHTWTDYETNTCRACHSTCRWEKNTLSGSQACPKPTVGDCLLILL